MKGLVAYYTKYGNGKIIAEAFARGLEESGNEITVRNILLKDSGGGYDFIVVSSPTRFGKMANPVKKFLKKTLDSGVWRGKPYIAIGTGMKPEGQAESPGAPGQEEGVCGPAEAAVELYAQLEKAELRPVVGPQKFFVNAIKGPLLEGEEERALTFGREVGRELARQ